MEHLLHILTQYALNKRKSLIFQSIEANLWYNWSKRTGKNPAKTLYLEGSYVSLQQWPDQLGGLIEYLMQQETILRKCEAVLDLSSVYEKMVQLCSKEDSRPPLAPAFIVKYLLVSFLYSKPSNRQIGQRTPSPQS